MVAHEVGLSHLADQVRRRARRIVSEDSLCGVAAFATTIHLLSKKQDLAIVGVRHDLLAKQRCCLRKQLEVMGLSTDQRKAAKERNYLRLEIGKPVDLPIPAAVSRLAERSAREDLVKEIQRHAVVLRNIEGR
jgi:hypothetical protein